MQNAETVLNIIRERGRRDLPLERLYRQLFNRELFLVAYGRIYANKGDGLSIKGNSNKASKNFVGDAGKGNTGDGIHVHGVRLVPGIERA